MSGFQFSRRNLLDTLARMIGFYNSEVDRLISVPASKVEAEVNKDKSKIKWTTDVIGDLSNRKKHHVVDEDVRISLYRPYTKTWVYANSNWNWTRHLMPKYLPDANATNRLICVTGVGAGKEFSALMTNCITEVHTVSTGQCFPQHIYARESQETKTAGNADLFENPESNSRFRTENGISDAGLQHFLRAYSGETITKEDLFYYIYGLLHSEDYRARYADNLSKELPRIPAVKSAADFWAFSKAGRALGDLHVGYESVALYPVKFLLAKPREEFAVADYRVTQMKFAKGANGEKYDKTTVIYNPLITITGIPLEAYDYIVNGKSALEWVMERQAVTTHKDSGIVNDANDWAIETMGNPAYSLELFQRVITVSLETMKIVRSLPPLGEFAP